MTRKYFGTDGIRGKANEFPMTADMAMKVAMASAVYMKQHNNGQHQNRVVIGKDTRLSGYMLEQAMAAGFVAMGMDVVLLGPIPTPGVAMLTRSLRADLGVMISASHNPYEDNGIKLFGGDGYKLDDSIEKEIEDLIDQDLSDHQSTPDKIGKASRLDDAPGRYVEFTKSTFPRRRTLEGLKIVIDCAHGAAYKVAPQVLWELEAEVISIGNKPNGKNINDGFGATDTANLSKAVTEHKADIGLALDGDADRVILVDENGEVIDGDQILALLATEMNQARTLRGQGLVVTVMSNLGLERYMIESGLTLVRTKVGDRYVVEKMREDGINLGGEQSGHIIMSDFGTTGDGLMAGLKALSALKDSGKPASEFFTLFEKCPQILKNVEFGPGETPLDNAHVRDAIERGHDLLKEGGRLLVRPSGTQNIIRVMAEGDNQTLIEEIVRTICEAIENAGDASSEGVKGQRAEAS